MILIADSGPSQKMKLSYCIYPVRGGNIYK